MIYLLLIPFSVLSILDIIILYLGCWFCSLYHLVSTFLPFSFLNIWNAVLITVVMSLCTNYIICGIPRSVLIDQVFFLFFPASLIILYWVSHILNFILRELDSLIFLCTLLSLILGFSCFLKTQPFCVLLISFVRHGQSNI